MKQTKRRWLRHTLVAIVVCVFVAIIGVRAFVIEPFEVPSASMQPTLDPGDKLIVYKSDSDAVHRGAVLVFDGRDSFAPYRGGEHYFVKRVIGLGGDHVVCCTATGQLSINGVALNEPYVARPISAATPASDLKFNVIVPAGHIWFMGDNRAVSDDSRAYLGAPGGGMVSIDRVVGTVSAIYWPRERAQRFDGGGIVAPRQAN